MAVAAADTNVFVHHHEAIFALMHRAAWADLSTGRIFTVVTGDRKVVGEDILMEYAVILLPVAARIFIKCGDSSRPESGS
ncbi:Uncharacterised protein [Cedecea neteri]|uniref:Uncharacterized protein n=1 Tax=Cedecea neteri TaxID=158822 RepID=A0A2X2ST05_9ENTR|nr:Uncharacterised protein [Cedecea neteri]